MMDGVTWSENTRNRVAQLVPVERSFIVVKQSHRRFYEPLLGDLRRSQIVAQPCDRGTAPAILYGILRAKSLGPDTTIAIFPSDHYVSDDVRFMRQVERAFDAVDEHPALSVLLGIRPDKAETSYGWIEPAARVSSWTPKLFRVKRFWEKPRWELARTLLAGGCLWNSAVVVARASVLEAMIAEHAPELVRRFNDGLSRVQSGDKNKPLMLCLESWRRSGFPNRYFPRRRQTSQCRWSTTFSGATSENRSASSILYKL